MPIQRPATPGNTASRSATQRAVAEAAAVYDPKPASKPAKPEMSPEKRQAIAIGGLVLCLLIGGGIVYWLLFGTAPKHRQVTIDPAKQTPDFRGNVRVNPPRPMQAIMKLDDTTWRANAPGAYMIVKAGANGAYTVAPNYDRRDFLNKDQIALVSGLVRARNDAAMASEWQITPDQLAKLKNVHLGGAQIAVTQAEKDELRTLFTTWNGASGTAKTDAEKALTKRLDELAKAHLDESRKTFATKLDEAKAILTPQQVEKLSGH